ncbi:MAG TPA: secretin N-terminal domain-containing protein, partial [Povalibacter sp.]|nr:secretin N-terminal domain-containing protein [Povalibacter sp.]
ASSASGDHSVPVVTLIAAMAKKTGKKFVVDPRVNSNVTLIEESPASIDYAEFLAILQVNGYAAVEDAGLVRVVPDVMARQLASPIVTGKQTGAGSEYVSKVIAVHNIPAGLLVPILRPLLPQQAHLVAATCTNDLLIVDTASNVKRIETLVQSLDKGEPIQTPNCASLPSKSESKT